MMQHVRHQCSIVHRRITAGKCYTLANNQFHLTQPGVRRSLPTLQVNVPDPLNRFLSSRSSRRISDVDDVLRNDRLIADLLRLKGVRSGDALQVRVVTESSTAGEESTTEVISLTDAVHKSVDLGRDLIALDIDQPIPVLRIADFSALRYRQLKKKIHKPLPVKQIKFQTVIAANDLQRKANQMRDYLQKGHNCLVSIVFRYNTESGRTNVPDKLEQLVDDVLNLIKDDGVMIDDKPKSNDAKTMMQFVVKPLSTRK